MNDIVMTTVNNGIQVLLSGLWIFIIVTLIKNTPVIAKAYLAFMGSLKNTIEANTTMLEYTRQVHEALNDDHKEHHQEVMDNFDVVITEVRDLRTYNEGRDNRMDESLKRIEKQLVDYQLKKEEPSKGSD